MEYVIQTTNLTKRFGSKLAIDQVNMNIAQGEIYGLIGRNGAGKTTLMRILSGLAFPTSGEIRLFEKPQTPDAGKYIGSLIENPGLFKACTAKENLTRYAILYGADPSQVDNLLRIVGLDKTGKKKVSRFSLGMKQRLGIAIALLGSPKLLILDEPVNGLDPAGIMDVRNLLLTLNKELGITILISSHLLDELAKVVTRYGILNNGKLVEEISAEELKTRFNRKLILTVNDPEAAVEVLKKYYFGQSEDIPVPAAEDMSVPVAEDTPVPAAEDMSVPAAKDMSVPAAEDFPASEHVMGPFEKADCSVDNLEYAGEKSGAAQEEDSFKYMINDDQLILVDHVEERAQINRILCEKGIEVSGIEISNENPEQYFVERMGR